MSASAPALEVTTLLGIAQLAMFAFTAGAGALVLVFAVRTATFSGLWEESITVGPAHKLFKAIAVLILATCIIVLLDWLRGALS